SAMTHEVVVTPLPGNLSCWNALAVQTEGADYVVRRGRVALLPGWAARRCPRLPERGTTAPLRDISFRQEGAAPGRVPDAAVTFQDEFRASLVELRALAQGHCEVAAFLRYARVPFFVRRADGVLVGDLRYDRERD